MRKATFSEEVWQEIAARGKFGETEDDVLRRVFDLPPVSQIPQSSTATKTRSVRGPRQRHATIRMHAGVHNRQLLVQFETGAEERWDLPDKDDKDEIRRIRDAAVEYALSQGASEPGQTNAVRKALTDAGYYLSR